jgi:hypothetical protein
LAEAWLMNTTSTIEADMFYDFNCFSNIES